MRWSYRGLGEAERVRLYTLQSLYAFLWITPAAYLLSVADQGTGLVVPLVGVAASVVAATVTLRQGVAHYLRPQPLRPWPLALVVLLVLATTAACVYVPGTLAQRGPVTLAIGWVVGWSLGAYRERRVQLVAAVTVVTGGAVLLPVYGVIPALVVGGAAALTVRLSLWLLGVVVELDQAREARASLAVAEERLRFSRDVHDVLGRDLSTIAVTSELAATLARRGDPSAAETMLGVRAMANDALREARELARGYRAPDLEREVSGARELLGAAGIEVTGDVDGVPDQWREVAALAVREGVTNLLRHAQARHVELRWDDDGLLLRNDGAPAPGAAHGDGTGLRGLRERVEPLGGRVETEQAGERFTLRLLTRTGGAR